jgi:hypothetical protein
MRLRFRFLLVLSFAAVLSSAGCECDAAEEAAPAGTGLEGSWKLVDRQCYCIAAPLPTETAVFTATSYTFYNNGQVISRGTYVRLPVKPCGSSTAVPGLSLTDANLDPREATATLHGNTLVLDYGSPCDAPRNTYERLP